MYTSSSFQNVAMRGGCGSSGGGINSASINSHRRGSFDCSSQSILAAMNRFVSSVQSMQQTVLVPSRLRDLASETASANESVLPPALLNLDPYDLYAMLGEVKNELLWGPSTGQTTVATMDSSSAVASQAAAKVNSGFISSPQMRALPHPLVKCQSSASLLNRSATPSVAGSASTIRAIHPHHLANQGKALSNGNLTKEALGGSLMASRGRLGHAMLSSDDGFGSLDSTASSSDSLSESGESDDCDSMLDSSCPKRDFSHTRLHRQLMLAPQQAQLAQHCNSSHLATAFKYHLQGLHTILQQLSDSADFLVDQYQQEVMETSQA